MVDKWFSSDPHFLHANILKFVDDKGKRIRPFDSLEEMHETIIVRYNSYVKPHDKFYLLGDITFKYSGLFNSIMSRLNGVKTLIPGNHDKIWNPNLMRWFDKIEYWKGFSEGNFTCTHVPFRLDTLRDGAYNVHGHTHQRLMADPHYINVCVEVRDYYPVSYDQILLEIKTNR